MKKRICKITAVMLVLSLLISGCSKSTSSSTSAESNTSTAEPATASTAEKSSYTFGTGGSSGAYYIIGAGIADHINNLSDSLNIVVQSTGGGGENVSMVDAQEMDFGFCTSGTLYNSLNGTNFMKDVGTKRISGVMALHYSFGQMLAKEGINTYADLKGKKVCLGTTSPEVYDMSKKILQAYGIDPEKDITAYYLSQDEGISKLGDGDIDATFIMAGIPTAAFTNAMSTGDFVLVDADKEILQGIINTDLPYAHLGVIPAGTYPGIDTDTNALEVRAEIFCNPDLPNDVVYDFCKLTYENWDAIKVSHSAIAELDQTTFYDTCIPLHPGARKYFTEIGLIK
jgi:TRAP transporter TAXI family solute receptor